MILLSCASAQPQPSSILDEKAEIVWRENMTNRGSEESAVLSTNADEPATAATAVNAFGLRLLADLAQAKRENVFVSPLSVFLDLAMTESGAAGSTQAAMRKALAVPTGVSEDVLHQSSSALLKSMQSQKGVQLSIANALWSDARLPLAASFVQRCRDLYQADTISLDFASPGAADTINAWVKQRTLDKIPTIVTPANLRDSVVVLTNAVYFKGGWQYKFDKNETKEGDFHLASVEGTKGRIKRIWFMHLSAIPRAYRSGPGFEAAALPYESSGFQLYAILPARGKTPQEALAGISVQNLRYSPKSVELDLKLPRFTLDFGTSLKAPLEQMGMAPALHDDADFKPMGSSKFSIGDVLHKTRLEVDEQGTVAAAATAVVMAPPAAVPRKLEIKTLVFDRPFALLLCDTLTNAILFAGVIYDPQ
jgi:serpin B